MMNVIVVFVFFYDMQDTQRGERYREKITEVQCIERTNLDSCISFLQQLKLIIFFIPNL